MKSIKILLFTILLSNSVSSIYAQTMNWNAVDSIKQITTISLDFDYSASYSIAYARKLNWKIPTVLNINLSMPAGEILLDDFKTSIGGQMVLINNTNFKVSLGANGIYRRYEYPMLKL